MDDDDIDWGIKMLLQENRDLKFKFTTLEAENGKLKALVERLRELITRVTNEVNLWDNQPLLDDLMKESVE